MRVDKGATEVQRKRAQYELLPPEGGWGYMVTAALTLAFCVTVVPMAAFGLIYGAFLQSIGNETTGTTLANGIFNTVFNFSGLAANNLLQRYSYRIVCFIGAALFCIGSFSIIFATNLGQLIVSFGVVQGIGMGIMVPAIFTAFNSYFDRRLNLMNGVAQALMVVFCMMMPAIGKRLMDAYGFRGTVAIFAALSLNTLVAAAALQPVKWHMKKRLLLGQPGLVEPLARKASEEHVERQPRRPLLLEDAVGPRFLPPTPRLSIISMGDRTMSVSTMNKLGEIGDECKQSIWRTVAESMDLGLFRDPVYVNISLGVALSFTSDVAFISIIPLLLLNSGFDEAQTALLMTVFFGADLVARVLFSVATVFFKLRNRYLVLAGAFLSAVFRTAFVMRDEVAWKAATTAALGFLRCFIQTPLPLVFADEYQDKFAAAFSLYMVVCGLVSLVFGPLMSFVKAHTQSDVMVVHLLTLAYLICSVSWTVELVYLGLFKRRGTGEK